MRKSWIPALMITTLAMPAAGASAHSVGKFSGKSCSAAGYSRNAVLCATVPANGTFTLKIPKSKDVLRGKGAQSMSGVRITVIHVPPPVSSRGGYGIRVRASGKFPPLKVSKGTLYQFIVSSDSLKKTGSLSKAGVYQVVH